MYTLEADGFCIRKAVFDDRTCGYFRSKFMEELSSGKQLNHSDTMWELRMRPEVVGIFEDFWSESDLLSSFDGVYHRAENDEIGIDWHVDQDQTHSRGCVCVQGFVALTNSNYQTGTISFLPGSHLKHEALCKRICGDAEEGDWEFEHIPSDDVIFEQCSAPVRAEVCPGDVVLWDSRTVHKVEAGGSDARLVAYLCMTPRSFATETVLRQRRHGYRNGISTTHWPHRYVDRGEHKSTRIIPAVKTPLPIYV